MFGLISENTCGSEVSVKAFKWTWKEETVNTALEAVG